MNTKDEMAANRRGQPNAENWKCLDKNGVTFFSCISADGLLDRALSEAESSRKF